jgi:hypothetical protein
MLERNKFSTTAPPSLPAAGMALFPGCFHIHLLMARQRHACRKTTAEP